ncbi:MAG TPA: hypothetical protein VFW07_22695 [Parafilimonas sp.]|nr:hypothetical protein [Parafilimonas sp.]
MRALFIFKCINNDLPVKYLLLPLFFILCHQTFAQSGIYTRKEIYRYDSTIKKFQLQSTDTVKMRIGIDLKKRLIDFDGDVFATIESDKDSTGGYPDWYCTDFKNKKCYIQLIPQKNGGSIITILYFDGYLTEYYSEEKRP